MKRRIVIILAILIIAILAGAVYVNQLVLSPKIKELIVKSLEDTTRKKVIIGSIELNIFKGLIIKDLIIYDGNTAIINAKEASCVFLIQPLFNKQIIIPSITFGSPEVYIERRPDNSINIAGLLGQYDIPKGSYKVVVRRVIIRAADLVLHDDALEAPFAKEIRGANIEVFLSLPASVRFKGDLPVGVKTPARLTFSGEYWIPRKEFKADIEICDFEPKEVRAYFEKFGFQLPEGTIDAKAEVSYKDDLLGIAIDGQAKGIVYSKDNLTARLDSGLEATIEYNFSGKALTYSGNANVQKMELNGVDTIDEIGDVKGYFVFDNSGLSCDNLSAETLGLAVSGKLFMADFADPILNIEVASDVGLAELEDVLKNPFKIKLPFDMEGKGKLFASLRYNPMQPGQCQVSGYLDTSGSRIVLGKAAPALEDVMGRFQYTQNQLSWSDLKFKYAGTLYESYGIVTNFDTPGVQMSLSSRELTLDVIFGTSGKVLTFSKFKGQYLNSPFSLEGQLDTSDIAILPVKVSGTADFDLGDLNRIFKNSADKFDKAKLRGILHAQLELSGNLKDIKGCSVDARMSSDSFSVYNIKPASVSLNYRQKGGQAEIPFMHAILYGGTIDAAAKMDLSAKDAPYSINADMAGAKIEELKADTAFRDKEISGSVKTKIRLNGYSNDLSRLTGEGRIDITNGKLWQLNLFRGLGVLIFTSDFSNVIFKEGSCDFLVKDKRVYSRNLELKSALVDMYGAVRIGFDNSITSNLKAEVTMEALEAKSANKVTIAIGRYTFIEISGTLKDPKYRIRPDVPSMVEDIAEAIFEGT